MNTRQLDTGLPGLHRRALNPAAYKTGETPIPTVTRPAGPVLVAGILRRAELTIPLEQLWQRYR